MKIAGFMKTSFVDFPGKIASVVFTQGCNLSCSYCHNAGLIEAKEDFRGVLPEEIFQWLSRRKGMIDGVVISGGEPTLQSNLAVFIEELKAMKLLVKLDTNGTNPDILRTLIGEELLDFIAMDLKAPLNKYEEITGITGLELSSIRKSVEIIKNSGLAHEFRTTLCPNLDADDIPCIILDFEITANYVVQKCRDSGGQKLSDKKRDLRGLLTYTNRNFNLSLRGFEVG